jgi:hypothetical protein
MSYALPKASAFCGRMKCYFQEMFPLARHLALSAIAAIGIAGFVRTVHGASIPFSAQAIVSPAWNIFAMLLILRLMDELKDRDIDRRLFPERPLPSGRVRESDIRGSLIAAMALYLSANAYSMTVLLWAVLVMGYAGLMFVRFFAPERLERSLPITLATHTPSAPLMLLQACVAAADRLGVPMSDLRWGAVLPYVGMIWFSILGWELARKIRAPEEETAYVTYSQILGPRGAIAAAAAVQGLAVLLGVYLYVRLDPPALYLGVLALGWLLCAVAYARFLHRPNSTTSRLKPFAAAFIFAVLLADLYAFGSPR